MILGTDIRACFGPVSMGSHLAVSIKTNYMTKFASFVES